MIVLVESLKLLPRDFIAGISHTRSLRHHDTAFSVEWLANRIDG